MVGSRILNRYSAKMKREKLFQGIATMQKVGILFEYNDSMYVAVKKLMNFFASQKIEVSLIAFNDVKYEKDKNEEQERRVHPQIKVFSKSDLNWYNKPENEDVDEFIYQKFDVLIDMSCSSEYVYKYISTLSMAKCKIGGIEYKNDPFDWIFIEKSSDVSRFTILIINFLTTVKIQNNV
jgi:hypothetical protein